MTTINLIYVGNIRENYLLAAVAEYEKRLSAYCRLVCTEIKEEKLPDDPSQAQTEAAMKKEGERILAVLPRKSMKIALCVEGKQLSSEEFSSLIKNAENSGFSQISFIIGGAFGLSEEVKKVCDFRLSLSKMTFTHRFARILLLEQIYRAENIAAGGKYHK
ncbi:MAG: 23S rRNA (pseudouridine(1915)-N(3))-methyltransferase RlmH [Eubacteriales bacterium]|nr:23S rRNA (pseudouridine(1915)-N(3))-methyltransferase RlmH [Eubacteriales bacterium]MCI6971528.1 23S rRNA (pseudouridine(1915)-N(3))-methyltransferase RlmH [Eubacterium sp.]MDD7572694.1 23S rRNA (pseudouridine(1915)-N(3))-methyltransferase RlmH [Eubacteriales bacterium]MDY5355648.1 23S rRNA (pseudouridine(1915)-N(3))-methyltransferase RlmH [Eubacteriales bacterium]